jgi:hypothetical protein
MNSEAKGYNREPLKTTGNWRWEVNHGYGGPNQKSGFIINVLEDGLKAVRECSSEKAGILEIILPLVVPLASEANQFMYDHRAEVDRNAVAEQMLTWLPGAKKEDVHQFVDSFIKSIRPPKTETANSRAPRNSAEKKSKLAGLFGQLTNGAFNRPFLMPVTPEGMILQGEPEEQFKDIILKAGTLLEGLTQHITREKSLTLLYSLSGTLIFGGISVVTSSRGASVTGIPTPTTTLFAVGINILEYMGIKGLLTPVNESTLRKLAGREGTILGRSVSTDTIRSMIQVFWLGIIASAYAFDAITGFRGMPAMGISEPTARVLATVASTFGVDFMAPVLMSTLEDIAKHSRTAGVSAPADVEE